MEIETIPFVAEFRKALALKDEEIAGLKQRLAYYQRKTAFYRRVYKIENDTDPLNLTDVSKGEIITEVLDAD